MKELIRLLSEEDIVIKGLVNLRGSEQSSFYFDVKKAYGNPKLLKYLGKIIADRLDSAVTCVVAKGYGGIPLAIAVSLEKGIPTSIIRESLKEHGLKKLIEGHVLNQDDIVAIIDDVFTTGSSIKEVAEIVEKYCAKIVEAHVIVKRGDGKMQFPINYLVDSKDLL